MIGLSITAIGMRPIEECIDIYRRLQPHLNLGYLELAIGSNSDLSLIPGDIPLVLHDRCLAEKCIRLPFSLLAPETWKPYIACAKERNVLCLSVHPPLARDAEWSLVRARRNALEEVTGVPVLLEVMPNASYWCSQANIPSDDMPLLVDISHVNIWHRGDVAAVRRSVNTLLPQAKGIHLSHNNGREDSHSLIPEEIWFADSIAEWGKHLFVTYESLPSRLAEYERLDKRRRR